MRDKEFEFNCQSEETLEATRGEFANEELADLLGCLCCCVMLSRDRASARARGNNLLVIYCAGT